ncbi:MAG: hypothetical protein K1X44_02330 [Alphaproteobacteria bacterium]|nr:hypothetical protein [Alphaproteobacteria bacterium]
MIYRSIFLVLFVNSIIFKPAIAQDYTTDVKKITCTYLIKVYAKTKTNTKPGSFSNQEDFLLVNYIYNYNKILTGQTVINTEEIRKFYEKIIEHCPSHMDWSLLGIAHSLD